MENSTQIRITGYGALLGGALIITSIFSDEYSGFKKPLRYIGIGILALLFIWANIDLIEGMSKRSEMIDNEIKDLNKP